MKPFAVREFALLCAPIALLGLAFVVPRLLHPPKDPNAVIALSVQPMPATFGTNSRNPGLQFTWKAEARGGPEYGYRLGYHEEVVAITGAGETIIYAQPGQLPHGGLGSTRSGSAQQGHSAEITNGFQIGGEGVPIAAKRLEWRGEVVAVPLKDSFAYGPASLQTLAKWAKIKGAAHFQKTIPLPFDADKYAVSMCQLEPVNATNSAKGIDTCVTVESRDQVRRVCRRLVAFDGHTRRILWDDSAGGLNRWWDGEESQIFNSLSHENILFTLRKVPTSWGEITFFYDVVFPAVPIGNSQSSADLKTIQALEKAGGARFSRHIVVRAARAKSSIPRQGQKL